MTNKIFLLIVMVLLTTQVYAQRTTDQLVSLYDFNESSGNIISGTGPDLLISDPSAVTWTGGGLLITAPTQIESIANATDMLVSCMVTNEITIEAWIRNATTSATGPARIMSFSQSGIAGGNFMMGQTGATISTRLKTTMSDKYGEPSLNTSDVLADMTLKHIVYTRNSNGTTAIWINGIKASIGFIDGVFTTWSDQTLTLASESLDDGSRAWLGELRLCAAYSKALSDIEIAANYTAGETVYVPPVIPDYNPLFPAVAHWEAPTYGTPVTMYVVEHSINNGPWQLYGSTEQLTLAMNVSFFDNHKIRVAGRANNIQGLWSDASDIYNAATIYPHPVSKPERVQ